MVIISKNECPFCGGREWFAVGCENRWSGKIYDGEGVRAAVDWPPSTSNNYAHKVINECCGCGAVASG